MENEKLKQEINIIKKALEIHKDKLNEHIEAIRKLLYDIEKRHVVSNNFAKE